MKELGLKGTTDTCWAQAKTNRVGSGSVKGTGLGHGFKRFDTGRLIDQTAWI
jgi:hypothetical protein